MRIEQEVLESSSEHVAVKVNNEADVVLVFGQTERVKEERWRKDVRQAYPRAVILGCSTAGEIVGPRVLDGSLTLTAIEFEHTTVRGARALIEDRMNSFGAGEDLAKALPGDGLRHVFVLSDGLNVNGSELVNGLLAHLPPGVSVTGGLAGDGDLFGETLVVYGDEVRSNMVACIGLYGERLHLGCGSLGGWDSFGPERLITRSNGNVLYELDGKPALDLYKAYLGPHAPGLPATGLLFPLSVRHQEADTSLVRTILAIDEGQGSLVFAGDVPEGAHARLMKANFDRLIDGAVGAASASYESIGSASPELALLISCVGRKMVLKQRIEEEVEGVVDVLGPATTLTGFYSYGEISPFTLSARCELHNQTMTITTLSER